MQSADHNECVTIIGPRQVETHTASSPEVGVGEVLVQTAYSGVSAGTELNVYRGLAPQWRSRQDPVTGLFTAADADFNYPLVYGYANVGRVAGVGSGVTGLGEGDLVFSYSPHCRWVTADASAVTVLPDLPDPSVGVFLANLNTAMNGVLDARPGFGDVVVVSGLGVLGLLVTTLVARTGAGTVIGVDPLEQRRSLALSVGADEVLAPSDPIAEIVRDRTDGRGADIVIEVSGAASALNEAIRTVGFGGLVVAMSWYGGTFESLTLSGEFHHNRVRIRSSQVGAVNPDLGPLWSADRRNTIARGLLSELDLKRLITNVFDPSEAALAYQLLDQSDPDVIQCVFDFTGSS